jgi:hypothetical protein
LGVLDIGSFTTIEHDRQMRAFGGDLVVVPLAARFGQRRYLGDIGDGPGAVLRFRALIVNIRFVRGLRGDGFGTGNTKKDAAVRGVIGPELGRTTYFTVASFV